MTRTQDKQMGVGVGGPVEAQDLENAINRCLSRARRSTSAMLEGRNALQMEYRPGCLEVRRLAVRGSSGLMADCEPACLVMPDPPPAIPLYVTLGISWRLCPVRDGAVVESAEPALRLISPGSQGLGSKPSPFDYDPATPEDQLTIGSLGQDGFHPLPVEGDRLDCCEALVAWSSRTRQTIEDFDRILMRIMGRISLHSSSALRWVAVLQPVLSRLAECEMALEGTSSPRRAVRSIGGLLGALRRLPTRAESIQDRDMADLVRVAGGLELDPADIESDLANACRAGSEQLHLALDWLKGIAESVGAVTLAQLPQVMYQAGKLYRRGRVLSPERHDLAPGIFDYRIDTFEKPNQSALALLWDLGDHEIGFGDAKLTPIKSGNSAGTAVYLEAISKQGLHWITAPPIGGVVVRIHCLDPSLRATAIYEPSN